MGSKTILSILLGISILFSASVTAISESSIPTEEKTETVERTVPNQNSAVNEVASVGDFLYGEGIVNKLICDIDGDVVIMSGETLVVDLNGYTWQSDMAVITLEEGTSCAEVYDSKDGGKLVSTGYDTVSVMAGRFYAKNIQIISDGVDTDAVFLGNGNTTVENCVISATKACIDVVKSKENAAAVAAVIGGEFRCHSKAGERASAFELRNIGSQITLSGDIIFENDIILLRDEYFGDVTDAFVTDDENVSFSFEEQGYAEIGRWCYTVYKICYVYGSDEPIEPEPIYPEEPSEPEYPSEISFDEETNTLTVYENINYNYDLLFEDLYYRTEEIVIADGVTEICSDMFAEFYCLRILRLPESITYIGSGAFANSYEIVDVYYGGYEEQWEQICIEENNPLLDPTAEQVTMHFAKAHKYGELLEDENEIFTRVCSECEYVKEITMISSGTLQPDRKNLIYKKFNDGTMIIDGIGDMDQGAEFWLDDDSITELVIRDGVTSLDDMAFWACPNLKTIVIGSGLTDIGKGLGPDRYISFEDRFSYCFKLTKIKVSEENEYYSSDDAGVLYNKDKTKLICYPNGNELTAYDVPEGVEEIYGGVFYYSCNLQAITIPASVTRIGDPSFKNCSNLQSITVHNDNAYYSSDEYGALFNKEKTILYRYPVSAERTSYTVPEGVETIASHAFDGTFDSFSSDYSLIPSRVKTVILPDSVECIEKYAFLECASLTEITMHNSITNIGQGAFNECSDLKDIYFVGNNKQWDKISIGENNDELLNANVHFSFAPPEFPGETKDPEFIPNIKAGQTLSEIADLYPEYQTYVFDEGGQLILSDDENVKTGYTAVVVDGEKVIGSSVMIVNGDGTGDGVVNGKDLIRLKKQMLYGDVVKHTEFVDYNGDGIVDENDAEYLTSMM